MEILIAMHQRGEHLNDNAIEQIKNTNCIDIMFLMQSRFFDNN